MTKVVNMKTDEYDVRIDRRSKWGNPFKIGAPNYANAGRKITREESIDLYYDWIIGKHDLLDQLDELKGKRLGCWCKPKACHGDVLVKLINFRDKYA